MGFRRKLLGFWFLFKEFVYLESIVFVRVIFF
jgi:hypothetical protein